MQLFVLAMVLALSLFDQSDFGQRQAYLRIGPAGLLVMMALPKLAVVGLYAIQCRLAARRLAHGSPARTLRRLDLATSIYRMMALLLFVVDLAMGALVGVRQAIGNLVLVDEVLVMLPALLMVGAEWFLYYPIHRRLREAVTLGRLDAGLMLYPIQSRGQFLLSQFRHQLSLMLVPLLLLLGWREAVLAFVPARPIPGAGTWLDAQLVIGAAGVGAVFLFTPVIIRWIWDTIPLPESDIRERLTDMCKRHGVRIRELLLWRTFGGVGNAAVMGLIAPVRFILLTDLLLESIPLRQVEAIMAHELAHIKKRHMLWMAVCIVAITMLLGTVLDRLLALAVYVDWPVLTYLTGEQIEIGMFAAVIAGWIPLFGWISRRFERQADAFALRHLSLHPPEEAVASQPPVDDVDAPHAPASAGEGPPTQPAESRVTPESVAVMTGALQRVALVNQIDPRRKSWRHGSIAWRQAYLVRLVGKPLDRLPIDRQVRWIQAAAALVVVVWLATATWTGVLGAPGHGSPGESGPWLILER